MTRASNSMVLVAILFIAVSAGFAADRPSAIQALTPNTLATQRGCRDGGFQNKNRVNPSWVSVEPSDAARIAEGVVRLSKVTYEDFPNCHESHDWNIFLKLDPQYEFMNSDANRLTDANGKSIPNGEITLEAEWETKHFPNAFLPVQGDRAWMIGRWVFDCGHPPYRSEVHPPKGVAFTRQEPHIFSGDSVPSNTNKIYVYFNGQGGYYYDHIGGQAYEFDVPMPPRPSSTAEPRYEIISMPFGGPEPTVTLPKAVPPQVGVAAGARLQILQALRPQLFTLKSRGGSVSSRSVPRSLAGQPTARIKYDLTSVNDPAKWDQYGVKWTLRSPSNPAAGFISQPQRPTNTPQFGAIIAVGWKEPATVKAYKVFRVTFDKLKIVKDHDPLASGEWRMWLGANGNWFQVSGLGDVDDGDTIQIQKSFLLTVPEDGRVHIQATGWESDPIDDDFRITNPASIPTSVLDNNDQIGAISDRWNAANSIAGLYQRTSERAGQSDESGDFVLTYRIEEAQRIPAGTPNATAPPGTSTAKRITVTFLSVKVLDDADGTLRGAGEIWFDFLVNGLKLRFPSRGTRDISGGSTVNLNLATQSFMLDLNDTVRISVVGKEDDSPTGTDSLGIVGRTYDRTTNFGAGVHTETSNKSDGQFQITYRIDVQ